MIGPWRNALLLFRDRRRWPYYGQLMRLDKPIGIYLLLWPTLWALWIAGEGVPNLLVLFVFVAGVVLMRSAGCVINDFADRKIDPQVARTRLRPLAAGQVTPREALLLFVGLCLVAFLLVLLMNALTIQLSFVAVALAAVYPFMKRYTYYPQVVLGLAFGWSIPMSFAAETGSVPGVAWLLLGANLFWTVAYDTMYAMVDRKDDLRAGVKSTAILFGEADRQIIGVLLGLALFSLLLVGTQLALGWPYYLGLVGAAALGYHQMKLIRRRKPDQCFNAFLNNHWVGMVVFAGIALHYALAA